MRKSISLILMISAISMTFFSCVSKTTGQKSYYLSNMGNDNNKGTSPQTPWKTISKVNSMKLKAGDSILFRAGDIWRESLKISEAGNAENYIVYSRYGNGTNPKILGSEKAVEWISTATKNIWQTSTDLTNFSEEYYPGCIFFVKDDSTTWGEFKTFRDNFTNLENEFEYTVKKNTHYIYSTTDPNYRYDAIEISQRSSCLKAPASKNISYIEINGIDLHYAREYGYNPGYPAFPGATNLIFRNCNIGYIGTKGSGKAYGIELVASNSLVENCNFSDCGRRAISMNLYDVGGKIYSRTIENVVIRKNTFKRGWHTTSLDLAVNKTAGGDTIRNIYFYNNYIDDSELSNIAINQYSNQIFIYQTGASYVNNIFIVNNILNESTAYNILIQNCDTVLVVHNTIVGHNQTITESPWGNLGPDGTKYCDMRNNIIMCNLPDNSLHNYMVGVNNKYTHYIHRDYNLYYILNPSQYNPDRRITLYFDGKSNYYYRETDWLQYKRQTGFDKHSPTPQSPNFIDYDNDNFHLTKNSVAVGSGAPIRFFVTDPFGKVDTLGKYDFDGNLRNPTSPSIGAFEQ